MSSPQKKLLFYYSITVVLSSAKNHCSSIKKQVGLKKAAGLIVCGWRRRMNEALIHKHTIFESCPEFSVITRFRRSHGSSETVVFAAGISRATGLECGQSRQWTRDHLAAGACSVPRCDRDRHP